MPCLYFNFQIRPTTLFRASKHPSHQFFSAHPAAPTAAHEPMPLLGCSAGLQVPFEPEPVAVPVAAKRCKELKEWLARHCKVTNEAYNCKIYFFAVVSGDKPLPRCNTRILTASLNYNTWLLYSFPLLTLFSGSTPTPLLLLMTTRKVSTSNLFLTTCW